MGTSELLAPAYGLLPQSKISQATTLGILKSCRNQRWSRAFRKSNTFRENNIKWFLIYYLSHSKLKNHNSIIRHDLTVLKRISFLLVGCYNSLLLAMIDLKFSPTIFSSIRSTLESRYNEPLHNDILGITNDFLYPSNSKIFGKVPRYNETSLQ